MATDIFWDLRRRYAREGVAALTPKSSAPHQPAGKTPVAIEEAIVRARKELIEDGLDGGSASIQHRLRELPGVPSEATIWRILTARGLIVAEPAKAPKRSRRRFTAERANECWQLDDTDWALADGTVVKVLNVVDDHSRLLVASTAMPTCTGAATLAVLAVAATVLGWPTRILSDNAQAFRHTVATALAALGVTARHSRPYHPQTQGKVERFHHTLKQWLNRQPAAATLDELQAQLDAFRQLYNHHRPHRALARRYPADVWTTAPKSGPADRPLTMPTVTYRSTVAAGGVYAGPYKIAIGTRHNGHQALTIITGTAGHVFIHGRLIRHLTINPTRRSQPLYPTRGRPPATVRKDPRHA